MTYRKAGFTLVELMIVVAIIGILAGALTFQVTKAGDAARAMRCKVNLKNLSQAAVSYAAETGYFPSAGSHEYHALVLDGGDRALRYANAQGWVGWTGRPNGAFKRPAPGKTACFYGHSSSLRDDAYQSITNGSLWFLTGKDLKTYICDQHKKICKKNGIKHVFRSYVMNDYFGFDYRPQGADSAGSLQHVWMTGLSRSGNPSTRLLFAELPIYGQGGKTHKVDIKKDYNGSDPCWADGVLSSKVGRYQEVDEEYIGFNHLVANRYVAHVSFADGHVEALPEPRNASKNDLIKLTKNLCNGEEIEEDIRRKMR